MSLDGWSVNRADRAASPLPVAWAGPLGAEAELELAEAEPEMEWYAVYTRARHEKTVARELERRGLRVLLPLCRAVHRWRDRRKQVELPLFPSYVFVQGHGSLRLRILSVPGSVYLVSDSQGPLVIPPAQIRSVAILTQAGRADPCPFLRQGARVRVVRGPLEGVEGILESQRNQHLLVVSIQALASSIRAEVGAGDIEAIDVEPIDVEPIDAEPI